MASLRVATRRAVGRSRPASAKAAELASHAWRREPKWPSSRAILARPTPDTLLNAIAYFSSDESIAGFNSSTGVMPGQGGTTGREGCAPCQVAAERVGFEPTVALLRRHAISSRAYSATLAPLRGVPCSNGSGPRPVMPDLGPRAFQVAERVGFEPTMELLPYWFSRPAPSTARPPLPA